MEKELWKDVKGYEGYYQISNLGRVKSLARKGTGCSLQDRILRCGQDQRGYLMVVLSKENKGKTCRVHRLVAEAFIANPENKPQVNHIDGNKQNNCVENLEWCTNSENQIHAYKTGLREPVHLSGEKSKNHKLTQEQVDWIRRVYVSRDKEFGCRALARKFNVSPIEISDIINNKRWNTNNISKR